ncbi:MAG: pre-peptidase C-terminal domain-containing protein [Pirellulales bacterium]|nr:pre-peptidase C-terminal domain-containing protein [Pirellulales bacterium]
MLPGQDLNGIRRGLLWVLLVHCTTSVAAEARAPEYAEAVAPLLRKYCVGCHGGDEPESALSLESYAALIKGGKRGAAVIAGRDDLSRLLLTVEGQTEPRMPPADNEAPTAEEIAVLRAWIVAGAKGPEGAEPDPTQLLVPHVAPQVAPRLAITALAWSAQQKLIAVGGYREVRLLSAEDRSLVRTITGLRGEVNGVSFSADGQLLAVASGEPGLVGEATLWQPADGTLVRKIEGHRDTLYAAVLSPDGKLLATSSYDQKIRLWDTANGTELRVLDGHNGAVFDIAFSPDGRLLASASGDRTVKLWNVGDGTRLDTFGQPTKEQLTVAFSPDGRMLAGAGADNRIRLWRLSETAAEGTNPLVVTRFAHEGAILDLAFSPDGSRLATAADDRTVKLWQSSPLVERHALEQQSDWPQALAFGPDGKQLAIGRLDGSLTLVDVETAETVKPMKPDLATAEPRGLQRTAGGRIRLTGKHLVEIEQLEFEPAGPVARLAADQPATASELWIDVNVPAEAPLGSYSLRLVNPGGRSNAVRLELDDLVQAQEAEPNGAPDAGTVVTLPASVWGVLDRQGDVDHIRFEAAAGQTLVFDLRSRSLGLKLDGVLTLLDEAGHVLASNNNFDNEDDPVLSYTFTQAGVYAIRVGDQVLAGSAEHVYRLSLGELPLVTGCYPPSIPAGATTAVTLVGYNLPADAQVAVAAGNETEVAVPVDGNRFRRRRDLKVAVDTLPQTREAEPNDAADTATTMSVPGVAVGQIAGQDRADADLFRFEARVGQRWIIETDAARRGSPIDTKLEVLDAAGQPVPRMLLQATRDSYVTFRGINSSINDVRLVNWEEMELNEFLYLQGEVCRLFRLPQGPDSGFLLYAKNGARIGYFDTSPTTHAVDEPAYIVAPLPLGTTIVPNGLPVFTLHYANDDDGNRRLGSDSQIAFTAPADGQYLVRVTDVRALGDARFVYRLIVRPPQPDFALQVGGTSPQVRAGSGRSIPLALDRIDGFDGSVRVDFSGAPAGFHLTSPIVIEAGHSQAFATIWADAEAPKPAADATAQITATAEIEGRTVTKSIGTLGAIGLDAPGKLIVRLEPAEVTIRPGTTVTAQLKVERRGIDGPISFAVENLPHGVYVDNIGLNGVLIPEGQSERQIFLTARPWVPATSRTFHALATSAGSEVSPAIVLHVHRDDAVARADGD